MTENNEIKDKESLTEENISLAPYVNEKLKYCLIAGVIILCIIAALAVVFSPEARKNREEKETEPIHATVVYDNLINT